MKEHRGGPKPRPAVDRFWAKVRRSEGDGCWEWTARTDDDGYGKLRLCRPRRSISAHRYSYELANGPIPDGLLVCHHCDNPPCVRPDHLFLGTPADNMRDKESKGRGVRVHGDAHFSRCHPELVARGEDSVQSKMKESDVRAIRVRCIAGETQRSVARAFGITQGHVSVIVNRKRWAHVD